MRSLAPTLAALVCAVSLAVPLPSIAGGIAYVDFEKAVSASKEARQAQQRLQQAYAVKIQELQKQRDELQKEFAEYEQKKLILTDDARSQAEQSLMSKQQQLQQNMMTYQQEMDQQVAIELQKLDDKLRTVSSAIAKERGYDLVVDKSVVVYANDGVIDMTDAVIQRYNAQK